MGVGHRIQKSGTMMKILIVCDECGAIGSMMREHAHLSRKRLRKFGWKCGLYGGADYCAACAGKEKTIRSGVR